MIKIKPGLAGLLIFFLFFSFSLGYAGWFEDFQDIFFKRYRDYPQMFEDMAFTIGDWDTLEEILYDETIMALEKNYEMDLVSTRVGKSIVHVCDRPRLPGNLHYEFYVINLPEKNAFAIPGGGVFITKPLLDLILQANNSDDILAFLYGHEIGHICRRHWITLVKEKYTGEFWELIKDKIIKKGKGGLMKELMPIILKTIFTGYSKKHERETDALGLEYMARAGYDLQGAIDLLELLKKLGGRRTCLLWCTHPAIEERIQTARKTKLRLEEEQKEVLFETLESCDSKTGVLAISISHPKGNFPAIGAEAPFQAFGIDFFPVNGKIKEELKGGYYEHVIEKLGRDFVKLPVGNYILFYTFYPASAMKRCYTPFSVEDEKQWGPLRVAIHPKTVSYIEVFPNGENASECQWRPSIDITRIKAEFIKRYILSEEGREAYTVDFSPLPDDQPAMKNIELSSTKDIQSNDHKIIFSKVDSMLMGKFNILKGSPSSASLSITCSTKEVSSSDSGHITISINGKRLVLDYAVVSPKPISQTWDITDFLQGADNIILFEHTKGDPIALYRFSIEAKGAGIGTFYKLSHKSY